MLLKANEYVTMLWPMLSEQGDCASVIRFGVASLVRPSMSEATQYPTM